MDSITVHGRHGVVITIAISDDEAELVLIGWSDVGIWLDRFGVLITRVKKSSCVAFRPMHLAPPCTCPGFRYRWDCRHINA